LLEGVLRLHLCDIEPTLRPSSLTTAYIVQMEIPQLAKYEGKILSID